MNTRADPLRFLNSLQGRFIAASLLCLPLFIGASGLLLENAFKENLLSTEQEQLQSQLYILLGSAEVQRGNLWLPEQLPEPRYTLMDSGLYAKILTLNPEHLTDTAWLSRWRSTSARLLDETLPESRAPFETNRQSFASLPHFFRLTYDLVWEDQQGTALPLRFQIYHTRDSYSAQLKRYRQQLWYGLSFLAMALLTLQVFIMRWGLRPLKKLVRELKLLPEQTERQLRGVYPREIAPVTNSLNRVLANEQKQRERYQNTLSDLAHSLKTPLAIIQGEVQQHSHSSGILTEQVERMNTIIRHQLQRAVLQTNKKLHTPQKIRPVVERLCTAMDKVYRDKHIEFNLDIGAGIMYPIESQDLFELLGNLIENACKYGRRQVHIKARRLDSDLIITIGDDGSGIASHQQQAILQRGARADTANPGQGIGLAITQDIVSAYGGSLKVQRSATLGGAEFEICLPLF
ncbi:MAG: GHKL domain-containing protein [Gammaproteobacteria bacterium]|nr:GHKL domain-containing protein [Gammaproteobacteria bacterium]